MKKMLIGFICAVVLFISGAGTVHGITSFMRNDTVSGSQRTVVATGYPSPGKVE